MREVTPTEMRFLLFSRRTRFLLLTCGVFLGIFGTVEAATINARSVALADVSAAISLAHDGDTVLVPAGTSTWTTPLTIAKPITLQGAGIGQTIVIDGLTADNNNLAFPTLLGKYYRLTGFEFRAGARTKIFGKGCVLFSGSTKTFRVDHCKFDGIYNRSLYFRGSACGVIDHCTFANPQVPVFTFYHDAWVNPDGKPGSWGDGSWASPIDWGGPNAIYIEDNTLSKAGDVFSIIDEYAGARFVFRHNTVTNGHIASHGTGSTGRYRSLRQWEIYDNTFVANPPTAKNTIHIRGGTGAVFNNTVTNYNQFLTLHTYRFYQYFADWSGSDGMSSWDKNDPAGVYLSGTASTGSKNLTLVVAGSHWTTGQWKGYTVKCTTTSSLYPSGYFHSCVVSNTADTIIVNGGSQITEKPFAAGAHFEIRKVVQSLDMVGASTGNLLDPATQPSPRWLNQAIDPVYVWNNKLSGVNSPIMADSPIREGIHFFNGQAKPNYQPYTYPHPLTGPAPPSNLQIAGQ